MARLGLAPLDFAGASLFEALFRARMCLQLGHFLLVCPDQALEAWSQAAVEQGLPCP